MQRADAYSLIARLRSAYPAAEFPEETVELYADRLEMRDLERMVIAIEDLIDSSAWMPAWSEILEAYQAVPEPRPLEIEEGPASPEQLARSAAEMRKITEMLKRARPKEMPDA